LFLSELGSEQIKILLKKYFSLLGLKEKENKKSLAFKKKILLISLSFIFFRFFNIKQSHFHNLKSSRTNSSTGS
jgi:hypothetical protein